MGHTFIFSSLLFVQHPDDQERTHNPDAISLPDQRTIHGSKSPAQGSQRRGVQPANGPLHQQRFREINFVSENHQHQSKARTPLTQPLCLLARLLACLLPSASVPAQLTTCQHRRGNLLRRGSIVFGYRPRRVRRSSSLQRPVMARHHRRRSRSADAQARRPD